MPSSRVPTVLALTALSLCGAAAQAAPFEQMLESGGVRFLLRCANDSSIGTLHITHTGLVPGPVRLEREIDGIVSGAELADLDGNDRPELYVYTTSAGSGSYGDVLGYAVTTEGGLREIGLPQLSEQQVLGWGYAGHDRFRVQGPHLVRSFPVYREGDVNAAPGAGTRELRYRLQTGDSGPALVAEPPEER